MRNALELLQQKELDLVRIRKETEALRIVAPLLSDDMGELADTNEGRDEHTDLELTGTDGFHTSATCVLGLSEGEISLGQPFLVPKPTNPGSSFWQLWDEKMRSALARVRGLSRSWYVIAGAILVMAIGSYEIGHRIGHRVPAAVSSASGTEASPRQPAASIENAADRLQGGGSFH